MRWLYIGVVAIFALVMLIFAIQNLELATMSFLGFNARIPLALLAVIIYVAGALTGGGLYALLRQSFQASGIGAPKQTL